MTISFVNATTTFSDSSSPWNFGGTTHTSGSGTNRAIVVVMVARHTAQTPEAGSLTWNGVAMTKAGATTFVDNTATVQTELSIWYLLDPAASTAGVLEATFPVKFPNQVWAHAINIEGSAGPLAYDAFGSNVDDVDPGTTAVSGSITTGQPNTLVIGAADQVTTTAGISWTDMTSIGISGSGGVAVRLASAYAAQASAGANTYDGTWDTQNEWAFVLASFYETAGGGDVIAGIKGQALRSGVLSSPVFGRGLF